MWGLCSRGGCLEDCVFLLKKDKEKGGRRGF